MNQNSNSRHGLRTGLFPPAEGGGKGIPPGGKKLRLVMESFGQQSHEHLAVEPGDATLQVLLGKMTEPDNALQSLEDQLSGKGLARCSDVRPVSSPSPSELLVRFSLKQLTR